MERTQKLINALKRADKHYTNGNIAKSEQIVSWLEDNVTAFDLENMNEEEYHLFESHELGFDSDCNYHEGWD